MSGSVSGGAGAPLLLASGLLLGMPHGAGDWLPLKGAAKTRGALALETAIYLMLALGVGALWWFAASWALGFFLALTAWHWGSGDAHWLQSAPGSRRWTFFAWGRGLLVMAAPLAFRARESAVVVGEFAGLAARGGAGFPIAGALSAAPWVVVLALGLTFAAGLGRPKRADFGLVWVETAALLALFWAAPPLFAVTLYFAVHAWRHILRVESLEGAPLRNAGQIARAVAGFHLRVAPITLLALAGMAPVLGLWPPLRGDALGLGAAFLVLISMLTLPHAVVVGILDFIARRDAEAQRESRK